MNGLKDAKPVIVICSRDTCHATAFYRDTLGLAFVGEDRFGSEFDLAGTQLRVSLVADFEAHGHTILGFRVADVAATVAGLAARGVAFLRIAGYPHDARGILALPAGIGHVAWMKDPDGNVLSITDV